MFTASSRTLARHRSWKNSAIRTLTKSTTAVPAITNVTVVGGGLMGAGIAQVSAQNGYRVTVVDNDEFSQKCMVQIAKSLDIIAKKKFPNEINAARQWSTTS